MKSKGFIQLSLLGWAAVAAGVVTLALSGALWIQTGRLDSVKAEYGRFAAATKALGDAQIAKNEATVATQKRITDDKVKSLEARLAATRAAADRLRGGARGSAAPAVPATTVLVDGAARDQRLLEVLRLAQEQADRLIELQTWAAEQAKLKP